MNDIKDDLNFIFEQTKELWIPLTGKTIFLTGGTGFFGMWLHQSFIYCNEKLGLNSKLIILTRDKAAFLKKYNCSYLKTSLFFIEGDITSFVFPDEKIDYIIHAATDASVKLNRESPLKMFDTIVNGTRHVLDLAVLNRVSSFLITSSGAVYGEQPSEISYMPETYTGAPLISDALSIYAESKRMAEVLCAAYYSTKQVPVKIARCYAFIGPYLPLDSHFAIGNFINNVIHDEDIYLSGDGTPYRSYMYASDLVIWLLKILVHGKDNFPYNVGSDEALPIAEVAETVLLASSNRRLKLNISGKSNGQKPKRYVPNINRCKKELGLVQSVSFETAIKKTISFYQQQKSFTHKETR